jgi:hypothetical protein
MAEDGRISSRLSRERTQSERWAPPVEEARKRPPKPWAKAPAKAPAMDVAEPVREKTWTLAQIRSQFQEDDEQALLERLSSSKEDVQLLKMAAIYTVSMQAQIARSAHHGISCDVSGMSPILGMRYQKKRENPFCFMHGAPRSYDLCESEYSKLPLHEQIRYRAILPPDFSNLGACGSACVEAARTGHLDLLRWLHSRGCPWGAQAGLHAARAGHLEVLKFLKEHGCPLTQEARDWASGFMPGDTVLHVAAASGHLEIAEWAAAAGFLLGESAVRDAAAAGHLAVVQWAVSHGFTVGEAIFTAAAEGTHQPSALKLLQWLREHVRSSPEHMARFSVGRGSSTDDADDEGTGVNDPGFLLAAVAPAGFEPTPPQPSD